MFVESWTIIRKNKKKIIKRTKFAPKTYFETGIDLVSLSNLNCLVYAFKLGEKSPESYWDLRPVSTLALDALKPSPTFDQANRARA